MRTTVTLATLLLLASLISGCVYSNVQRPLGTEFNKTELGARTGQASCQSILWLVAWGDCGTRAAATDGRITTIRHADMQLLSVLFGLYARSTTIVYGD